MAQVAIIGAGLAGLAAALFLARRGHEVDLFERDGDAPPPDAPDAFAKWTRRGVPQARHAHAFLGLSSKTLKEEAPDVFDRLAAAGAFPVVIPNNPLTDAPMIASRRLTYEAVIRQAVTAEKNVRVHAGAAVEGLIAAPNSTPPRVVGVRLADGQECRADLVADASGRWTKGADWLAAMGARPWREQVSESPFVYLTRHYALKPGAVLEAGLPVGSDLSYGGATGFPADNGVFAIVFLTSTLEPHRNGLARNERFDAVLNALPAMAAWLDKGTPINDVQLLGRIDNRRRSLVDNEGPVVSGYVLLGDSAMHTNPVFGRGVSLAFSQAQHLARTAEQSVADPLAYAAAFQDWTRANISAWYNGSVQADLGKAEQMARAYRGEDAPRPPTMAIGPAMAQLIKDDPDLALKWARLNALLDPPFQLFSDPTIMARAQTYIAEHPDLLPPDALSRKDFEAIMTA